MARPGFRDNEYIMRDQCVPNLGKFRQIWTYMIRLWNTSPITLKFWTSRFFDTLKMEKGVNFTKFQMLAHYDVIVDQNLGKFGPKFCNCEYLSFHLQNLHRNIIRRPEDVSINEVPHFGSL